MNKIKILIVRFSSLGDIILTQAIIRQLKILYPDSKIDYLTKPIFKPLISTYFDVNSVFTEYKSLTSLLELRKQKYDLVLDLHNKFNSWFAKTIINGEKTVTYDKKRSLRKKIVAHKTGLSINSTVDLYNSVFDKIQKPFTFLEPEIILNEKLDLLPAKNKLNVVIFPGATHNTKRIPQHKLISFINNYKHPDTNFYLLGSAGESDITAEIAQKSNKSCMNLAGEYSLESVFSAINEADIVITNDSGPMHIAAILRKPQIAFFGSTNVSLGFRPLNSKSKIITHPIDCSPCTLHGQKECPLLHFACMQNISVDEIYKAYQELT